MLRLFSMSATHGAPIMLSHCRTIFLAACLIMSLTWAAGRAAADDGPPIPEPGELMTLVRDTVLAVDKGNKTADYTALHAMAADPFQAAYPAEKLASLFAELRATKLDMEPVRTKLPQTTRHQRLTSTAALEFSAISSFQKPSWSMTLSTSMTFRDTAGGWPRLP